MNLERDTCALPTYVEAALKPVAIIYDRPYHELRMAIHRALADERRMAAERMTTEWIEQQRVGGPMQRARLERAVLGVRP
jgi:hypothetical protein